MTPRCDPLSLLREIPCLLFGVRRPVGEDGQNGVLATAEIERFAVSSEVRNDGFVDCKSPFGKLDPLYGRERASERSPR
jgi:hypothetical protein